MSWAQDAFCGQSKDRWLRKHAHTTMQVLHKEHTMLSYLLVCVLGCSGDVAPIKQPIVTYSPVQYLRMGSGYVRTREVIPVGAVHAQWERDTDGVWRLYYRMQHGK